MAKRERTNYDLLNTTQKSKDQVTQTPLKTGVNSCALEELAVLAPLSTSGTRQVTLVTNLVISQVI